MAISIGKMVVGTTKYYPKTMLSDSIIGGQYELEIVTDGVPNPEAVLNKLRDSLKEKFQINMFWGEVRDNVIRIQIIGSPFAWTLVLAFIPTLLALLGIIVSLISVFLLVKTAPNWVLGLLALGFIMLIISPRIARMIPKRT